MQSSTFLLRIISSQDFSPQEKTDIIVSLYKNSRLVISPITPGNIEGDLFYYQKYHIDYTAQYSRHEETISPHFNGEPVYPPEIPSDGECYRSDVEGKIPVNLLEEIYDFYKNDHQQNCEKHTSPDIEARLEISEEGYYSDRQITEENVESMNWEAHSLHLNSERNLNDGIEVVYVDVFVDSIGHKVEFRITSNTFVNDLQGMVSEITGTSQENIKLYIDDRILYSYDKVLDYPIYVFPYIRAVERYIY